MLKCLVSEGRVLGSHTQTASLGGDSNYAAASATGTLKVVKGNVKITVASVTGQSGKSVTLTAKLTNMSNAPLTGRSLSFSVAGISIGAATTDATGVAKQPYSTASGTVSGTYTISVTFAGDASHNGGTKTGKLVVK